MTDAAPMNIPPMQRRRANARQEREGLEEQVAKARMKGQQKRDMKRKGVAAMHAARKKAKVSKPSRKRSRPEDSDSCSKRSRR